MEVRLSPDQEAFIRQAIESGRFERVEDAVQEALSLWEERERKRAEILAAVDIAEASLARGEGHGVTQRSMRELAGKVKRRGRQRLAAVQKTGVGKKMEKAEEIIGRYRNTLHTLSK